MLGRILTFVLFGAAAGILGYWTAERDAPTTQLSERILTPVVAPGELLKVEYQVERRKNCHVHLEQILLDGERVRWPIEDEDYEAAPGPVGHDTFVIGIEVPRRFAQGTGRYRAIRTYTCNVIHRLFWPIVVISPDVEFTVRGPPTLNGLPIPVLPE